MRNKCNYNYKNIVDNRFELIVLASHRGREITSGAELTIPRDNDKNAVVSLREIADETIVAADLKESMITSLQTQVVDDEAKDENEEDDLKLSEFLEKEGFNYWNYSDYFKNDNSLVNWKDNTHLSNIGAEIFTQEIKNRLNRMN